MDDLATEANTSRPGSPVSQVPELPATRQPAYRFKWDGSSFRHTGPPSVSEATDHRDGLYGSPKGDIFPFNNTSSLALTLPHDWSSSKHGFNAISTVLNNPHRRAAPPKAHSSLPAVPPAELPRVKRKDFESYLSSIAPEWEQFERSARLGRDGAAQIYSSFLPEPDLLSTLSPGPLTSGFPRTPRTAQPPGRPLPSLNIVPSVYFDSSFDLGDPRTFALVTEALEGEDGNTFDPAAIAHSLPLLEKLSHYADVVEQHLVREISLRSSSFFSALTNLQDLQVESRLCLDRVSKLRDMLREVDERTAKRGLEMVRLESRLANLDRVSEGAKVVKDVGDLIGVADGLVHTGEWGEALGVIEELDALWETTPTRRKDMDNQLSSGHASIEETYTPIPLSSLQAFSSLPAHLRDLTLEIASSLTTDLVSVLTSDLHGRTESSLETEKANELLRDRLKPLLHGLVRTEGVKAALGSWRDLVMVEVRGAVKRHLSSSSDVDEDDETLKKTLTERSVSLAKELREMSHDDFLKLAHGVYGSLLRCIHGVQAQSQAITSLLGSISPVSTFETDLSDVLASACELANARASKLILVRAEQHAQLPLPAFHALFEATWQFVVSCEVLCRKMIVGLRGAIVSQAKAFLASFHSTRISSSAKLVEEEQWAQIDVMPDMQHTVKLLVDAAMRDPKDFVLPKPEIVFSSTAAVRDEVQRPLSPPSTPPQGSSPSPLPSVPSQNAVTNSKQLLIEEHPYFVVSATLQVLVALLSDYVKLIVNIPLLTTDAVGRVIEFLKAFNSRTCQVVLGAGAMRSAGLKNITAKHLALASQSLSIAIMLIPYIRETFRRHLSTTQAVMLIEFDKLRRDYQEHQNEIHAKLVVIMGDRLSVHCRSLQEVKWDVPPTKPGPNGYMELLVKETVTLHKVLFKYLPAPAVELVMTQVLAAINHRLSEEYTKIELSGQVAKDRLLQDARYLHEKMTGLKHVGTPGEMLETVVQEKVVPGGTPVPVKKSRLSTKMAAVVAGAGVTGKENGKITKNVGQDKAHEAEEKPKEDRLKSEDRTNVENSSSPPPLPEKGFRMAEPEDSSKGGEEGDESHGSLAGSLSESTTIDTLVDDGEKVVRKG